MEDSTIREIIESFGPDGSFRIGIKRVLPEEARDASGKMVATAGHVGTVDHAIDEDWLMRKFGGQKYELTFKRKNEFGRFVYAGHKTMSIAGEPNLSDLPRAIQPGAAPAPVAASESPTVLTKTIDVLERVAQQANERADRADRNTGGDNNPAFDRVLQMMQAQLDASYRQNEEMRREFAEREKPAPVVVDTFKDQLLNKMIDGDTARVQSVRMQYESELRVSKENAIAEERRIREVFERDKTELRMSHEREMALMRNSHDNSLLATRQSHEISLAAAKSSFDTQIKMLEAENRRLERDNADLRVEVKDLRAKKDKTPIEIFKEVEQMKDALGIGDSDEKTGIDKFIDAGPAIVESIGSMLARRKAAEPAAAVALPEGPRPGQVVAGPNGQRFVMSPRGRLVPVKRRPQVVAAPVPQTQMQTVVAEDGTTSEVEVPVEAAPAEAPVPEVDPVLLSQLIGYLENALGGNQDPEVVAQSMRSRVPEEVMVYLRDRITEHGLNRGVDEFLSKVAKLPASSPLMAQAGRNWIRKVGGSLVGE